MVGDVGAHVDFEDPNTGSSSQIAHRALVNQKRQEAAVRLKKQAARLK